MNLRKNVTSALLLSIGLILHYIMPGAIAGMKFDVQLTMLFVIIAINLDFKNALVSSLLSGILTALTTTFPGGQLPNIIDKLITGISVYLLLKLLQKFLPGQVAAAVTGFIGTIISGTVFLSSALAIVGLPAPFMILFTGIVIPTAVTNIFVTVLFYNLVGISRRAVAGLER